MLSTDQKRRLSKLFTKIGVAWNSACPAKQFSAVVQGMKKLLVALLLIVSIQSYGIFGAVQAERIIYSCEVKLGPLCYVWKENAFSKVVGNKNAELIENKLQDAKESFEEDFLNKFLGDKEKKSGLSGFFDKVSKQAGKGLDEAKKVAGKVLKDLEDD